MESENEILGYVLCKTCNEPKSVKQGTGKRSNFVYARCSCGVDTRTGKCAQAELSAFKPLAEIEAEITLQNKPLDEPNIVNIKPIDKPNTETVNDSQKEVNKPVKKSGDMSTSASVGVGVMVGLFFGGFVKLIRAVV